MSKNLIYSVFFCLGIQSLFGQHRLEIVLRGVDSSKGAIAIALYDDADNFLDFEKALKFQRIDAKANHKYTFENLKEGIYAVASFYDENSNDRLDTNFIGIPKEALGTSGTPKNKFGPPRFKNCKFYLNSNQSIEIELKKIFDK